VKNYLWMILFCILLLTDTLFAQDYFKVRWVDDGDTIVLVDGRRVRYIGINAPEIAHKDRKAEPYGNSAKRFNKSLLLSKKIRIEFDKEKSDRYGRVLAYVYLADNTFVNLKMLEAGLAYYYPHSLNHKYKELFLKTQRKAMKTKHGIWKRLDQKGLMVIGNRKSRRFHSETCRYGKHIKQTNRVILLNRWKAFWEGFAPCKKCQGSGV